ncbi:MAG TPA: NUDIX domain-containing protein [Hanamia sp.]|jgi:8-oxo-dGTP diphosphatase|nr:NUDIX domain-containing protein [Hanamia sp.]
MFNVRVYGLLINEKNEILLSDEIIRGNFYTKFPGGGMEFGEGTIECLKREFKEELQIDVEVLHHFYTTDYYQRSYFNPDDQIISIYYRVSSNESFDLQQINSEQDRSEQFRFIHLSDFSEDNVSLPIDKTVARLLVENGRKKNKKSS